MNNRANEKTTSAYTNLLMWNYFNDIPKWDLAVEIHHANQRLPELSITGFTSCHPGMENMKENIDLDGLPMIDQY